MRKRRVCRLLALVLAAVMLLAVPVAAEEKEDVVIVLDPGHGGLDSGTEMKYDGTLVCESVLNLKIAEYCRDYLLEHYENAEVLLTRETDEKVTLDERVKFAVDAGADYLLSIHLNSDEGYADGALALVPRGRYRPEQAEASIVPAEAILEELELLGLRNRGTTYTTNTDRYPDGSYKDALAIIRGGVQNNIPAVIMEQAFLDNESDYRNFLSTEEQLAALGRANALGLARTLGLEEKSELPFLDVRRGDWFYDPVKYVWEEGLMQGISDTEFGPALPANRAMVVTLLYRMDGAAYEFEESSFADVEPGVWYHAPVEWALLWGITTGVSDTEFAPGRNVIREQFVTFLHRYAGEPEPEAIPERIPDWQEVSEYAANAMAWALEAGLLAGYEDGTIRPLRELNRAELAVLMQRFHRWHLHETGELVYEWTPSATEQELEVGESFELTITNQFGQTADAAWTMDTEGVVQIDGTTVTALSAGSVLLSAEVEGEWFDCLVVVREKGHTWTISHEDVTIKVGESFYLKLKNEDGETASVTWTASKSGFVTISGNKIKGSAKGTVTVSCTHEGQTYECIVRVKSA